MCTRTFVYGIILSICYRQCCSALATCGVYACVFTYARYNKLPQRHIHNLMNTPRIYAKHIARARSGRRDVRLDILAACATA